MKNLFSAVLILVSVFVSGQTNSLTNGYDGVNDIARSSGIVKMGVWIKNSDDLSDIKGSPYLFDSWYNNAKLYVDNTVYNVMSFNFNVQNQRFEAKFSEDSVLIMNTTKIKKIILRDKVFSRFELEDNTSNPFFEVIGKFDNSLLLKKYTLSIKEGSFNPMTQKVIRPSEYIVKEEYFTANLDGTNVKDTKLKKSTILKLFDDAKQEKVKEYADENDLNFKDENDVHRIFEYSNTL